MIDLQARLARTRLVPTSAGEGFQYVSIGDQLIHRDEYFNDKGEWVPTSRYGKVLTLEMHGLYRRRVAQ